jgi:membrane protein DedA with SNARE-associated domain
VALGSASAKFIHYIVTFFISGHLSEKQRKQLDVKWSRVGRWAFLALFVVAATPLPDEPVIIPLGLLKYNPAKFYIVYFLGKLIITILGAYLGRLSENLFASRMSQDALMIASIVLTVVVTIVLLKVDVGKIAERVLKRKAEAKRNNAKSN